MNTKESVLSLLVCQPNKYWQRQYQRYNNRGKRAMSLFAGQ